MCICVCTVYICIYVLVEVQVVPRYIVHVYPWSLYHKVYSISILVFRHTCICISNYPGICIPYLGTSLIRYIVQV
jgi:hypothetical protein